MQNIRCVLFCFVFNRIGEQQGCCSENSKGVCAAPPERSSENGELDLGAGGKSVIRRSPALWKNSGRTERQRSSVVSSLTWEGGPFVKEVGESKGARPTFGNNVERLSTASILLSLTL